MLNALAASRVCSGECLRPLIAAVARFKWRQLYACPGDNCQGLRATSPSDVCLAAFGSDHTPRAARRTPVPIGSPNAPRSSCIALCTLRSMARRQTCGCHHGTVVGQLSMGLATGLAGRCRVNGPSGDEKRARTALHAVLDRRREYTELELIRGNSCPSSGCFPRNRVSLAPSSTSSRSPTNNRPEPSRNCRTASL